MVERSFILWNGLLLVESGDVPAPIGPVRGFAAETPVVPVSSADGSAKKAYILEVSDEAGARDAVIGLPPGARFADVMFDLGRYTLDARTLLLRALALERWSNRYRYCPACAYRLSWTSEFDAKICANPQRVHRHFPRLDPAIIVLVTGDDRALLGRAARYPAGMYSTLAGFVAPGESLEEALRREVYEEAGIRVGAVRYFGSESWPFPRSLMVGFFAQAQSSDIVLRDGELEDARWFERHELQALADRMKATRPHFETIARRLIDCWLARELVWDGGAAIVDGKPVR